MELGAPYSDMEIASFMSCSKGYMGECVIRGGYAEVINMAPGVFAMLQKSISAKLCPTVIGQACMNVVVNPPRPGEASHESFTDEVNSTLASYAERAKLVADTLNSIPVSISCHYNCQAPSQIPNPHGPAPTQSNPVKISSKGTGADTKILWATTPPITFKHKGGL